MSRESNFYITPYMLARRGACNYAVDRMRDLFRVGLRDRVFLTEANVRRLLASDYYHRVVWPAGAIFHNKLVVRNARMAELLAELNRIIDGFSYDLKTHQYYAKEKGPAVRARSAPRVYDILVEMASILHLAREQERRNREDNYDLAA